MCIRDSVEPGQHGLDADQQATEDAFEKMHIDGGHKLHHAHDAVSYTHLTLPTSDLV